MLSMQNAVFRREPNISPYHHIIVDEFPDYGTPSSPINVAA
ncbi:hypothetical protein B4077_6024 [Bacillus cereus]|uniref:Uncharacterized protein n=1 Tax=Bacillus cereus TaxID=1396 RepID=A0A0G8EPE3_BACCE|nr:hypothetical protein B4077_6024 [Bacillus cereus]